MAELVILGSGSGFATADRFNTSIALLVEPDLYLFDCGEPVGASLYRAGIDPLALKTLFVSHLHPDHVGGLASLMFSIYLPGRSNKRKFKPWSIHRDDPWYRDGLWFPKSNGLQDREASETRPQATIQMPSEGIEAIRNYLSAIYLHPSVSPFDLIFEPVIEGPTYDDGVLRVAAVPNAHLSGNFAYQTLPEDNPGQELQSYSFSGEVEGHKFVFSGDIDRLSELEPLLDGASTLIVEVAHYDPEEIFGFVKDRPLKNIILTHIHPGLEERITNLVNHWSDPRIRIARDGMHIPLKMEEENHAN